MTTYTIKEAAEILHYNAEYLRQQVKKGEIKGIKIRGKWLIKEETLKTMLEV